MTEEDASRFFEEHGYSRPVPVLEEHEAKRLRERVERFEREHPEAVGRLDLKASLLFPWLDALSRHPAIMRALEPLIGRTCSATAPRSATRRRTGEPS